MRRFIIPYITLCIIRCIIIMWCITIRCIILYITRCITRNKKNEANASFFFDMLQATMLSR